MSLYRFVSLFIIREREGSSLHFHVLFQLTSLFFFTFYQKGKRPKLPEELETLISETEEDESANKLREEFHLTESDIDTMRFLIDVFHRCTEESPSDRLNAVDLHEMILTRTKSKSPSGTSISS